jgi:hypothetical protein
MNNNNNNNLNHHYHHIRSNNHTRSKKINLIQKELNSEKILTMVFKKMITIQKNNMKLKHENKVPII